MKHAGWASNKHDFRGGGGGNGGAGDTVGQRTASHASGAQGHPSWCETRGVTPSKRHYALPTLSLDVTSLVANSCGYYRSQIEQRAAHEFAVHLATQRGRAKRLQHRHPPRAQPVAPLRERHCRRPRLTPGSGTEQAPHREQEHPGDRTRKEKRPKRFKFLVLRCPPAESIWGSGSVRTKNGGKAVVRLLTEWSQLTT